MSYFNSVFNLFLNIACIMNGVTKKQGLTKQNLLKIFYYNKIVEVKTFLSVKKITKQSKQNSYTSLEIICLKYIIFQKYIISLITNDAYNEIRSIVPWTSL